MVKLAVFSDLDGTLLDHDSYSYAPARPALDRLEDMGIPLILATSKTAAEVAELHDALGLGAAPAIIENGAGIFRPGSADADNSDYETIRARLDTLPLRAAFTGFGDMTAKDISDMTGLPLPQAEKAKTRAHSEPGLYADPDTLQDFIASLEQHGITARKGGRFLTLSLGRTKADAVREVAREIAATHTLALGDAPNDIEMLETATHGVIIRNDHGTQIPTLPGEATGRITRSEHAGPTGWNTAVLDFLETHVEGATTHG